MISAIHTALSGLTSSGKQLDVFSHNIANINRDGFKKSDTTFVEAPSSGVLPVVQKYNSPGPAVLKDTAQRSTYKSSCPMSTLEKKPSTKSSRNGGLKPISAH